MGAVRVIFTVLASIILVLTLFSSLALIGVNKLFYEDTYIKVLEENNFYNEFASFAPGETKEYLILPKDGIKGLVDDSIKNITHFVRGETQELNLVINFDRDKIIASLRKPASKIVLCKANQEMIVNNKVVCKDPTLALDDFIEVIINTQNMNFPEKINLVEQFGGEETFIQLREYYSYYRIGFYALIILNLILIGLLFLINRKSKKTFFLSLGIILIIVGILGIVFQSTSIVLLDKIVADLSQSKGAGILSSIGQEIFRTISLFSMISLALGIASLVTSFLIPKKSK